MLKCQDAARMFTVDYIPDILNERDFKRYVAESREFIGCYIEEDVQQTKKLDEHLEKINKMKELQLKRQEMLKEIREKMESKNAIKKVMSDILVFDIAKIMYKQKLSEIIFGLILGNGSAKMIAEKGLIKEQLTVSVVPLLLGSFY